MMFQRLTLLAYLTVLPLLAACTQTTDSSPATPALDAAVVGPGAQAALEEVERTREKHKEQATSMAVLSFFDPIGITALAKPVMEAEQRKEIDEKYQRVEEELRKTIARGRGCESFEPKEGQGSRQTEEAGKFGETGGRSAGGITSPLSGRRFPYILNTPNFVSGTGAFSAAEKASASTRRVSEGRMMPSSHSRAVA